MIVIDKVNFPIKSFKKVLEFSEIAFVVTYLILYAAGIIVLFLMGGASEGEKGPTQEFDFALNRLLFFFNYFVTLFLLILRSEKTLYTLMSWSNGLFLLLIALVPLSTLWSVEPGKTLSASIAMIGTCLFGLYFASNYSPKQQLQLLGWSFVISILLSFLFAIALRKYGIMGGVHTGAWRGIYTHKNWLGRMMVLASGTLFLLANDAKKYQRTLWIFFGLAFLLILLSRSSSSLINAVLVVLTVWVSRIFRFHTKLLIPVLLSIIAVGVVLSLSSTSIAEAVVGSLGKDLSGTGRTDIWPYSIEKISQRPFLGYGFAVFWNGLKGESAIIVRALKWPVPNSHNGFIDLGIDFGLLGIGLFAASFFQTLVASVLWIRRTQTWISLWSLLLLLFIILSNLTESALLERNSLIWVMYTALVFTLSLEQRNFRSSVSKSYSL